MTVKIPARNHDINNKSTWFNLTFQWSGRISNWSSKARFTTKYCRLLLSIFQHDGALTMEMFVCGRFNEGHVHRGHMLFFSAYMTCIFWLFSFLSLSNSLVCQAFNLLKQAGHSVCEASSMWLRLNFSKSVHQIFFYMYSIWKIALSRATYNLSNCEIEG